MQIRLSAGILTAFVFIGVSEIWGRAALLADRRLGSESSPLLTALSAPFEVQQDKDGAVADVWCRIADGIGPDCQMVEQRR